MDMSSNLPGAELDHLLQVLDRQGPWQLDPALVRLAVDQILTLTETALCGAVDETGQPVALDPRLARALWRAHRWSTRHERAWLSLICDALLRLARQEGTAAACRYYGLALREQRDWDSALSWLARAAEAGERKGWFECGWVELLRSGPADPTQTIDAQKQEHADAEVLPRAALIYFQQGADSGDAQSAYLLSRHWTAIASRSEDVAEADEARAQAEDYLQIAATGGSEYALLPWSHALALRGQWQAAFDAAVAAALLRNLPPAIARKTFHPARWAALHLLARAPRDAIANWEESVEQVSRFADDMSQTNARASFIELLAQVRERTSETSAPGASDPIEQALRLLLQEVHGVPVSGLFSPDRAAARQHQRSAFERIRQLLRQQQPLMAQEALEAVFEAARHMQATGWTAAWEVLSDAGLHWLRGQLLMGLGRRDEALEALRESATLKNDADHVAMCYERMAALFADSGDYADAAKTAMEGFRIGGHLHAGMLVRFATLKFRHHPAANGRTVLWLLKYMVDRQSNLLRGEAVAPWRYLGNDAAWTEIGEIPVPRDERIGHTLAQITAMFQNWCVAVGDRPAEQQRITEMREWLVDRLMRELMMARAADGLPTEPLFALACLCASDVVQRHLAHLMQATVNRSSLPPEWRGTAVAQRRHLAELLQTILAGCSAAGHIPQALADAAADLACARPGLWDEDFRAAQATVSLLWRALLERYADGDDAQTGDPVAAFDEWLRRHVASRLACIADDGQRRRWFFELLVGNPAAVEYVMSERVARAARELLRPLLDLRATTDIHRWLHGPARDVLDEYADRLLLRSSHWQPRAHAGMDTDTGRYACESFDPHLSGRLAKEYKRGDKELVVESRWHGAPPPVSALQASVALTELVNLTASQRALSSMGLWAPMRSCLIHIDMDQHPHYPVQATVRLLFGREVGGSFVSAACERLRQAAQARRALVDVVPRGGRELRLTWTLPIEPRWASLPAPWLRFFNAFKEEYDRFRQTRIATTGFFDLMERQFPADFPRWRENEYAEDWARVLHMGCDRLWALFLTNTLSGLEDDRNALTTLHGLKNELDMLRQMSITHQNSFRRQLDLVRNRLLRVENWTRRMLAEELNEREISLFDLSSLVCRAAERTLRTQTFNLRALPDQASVQVLGPRRVLERVLGELMHNAARHGADVRATLNRRSRMEWSIEITNTGGSPRGRRATNTGIGLRHASALCKAEGMVLQLIEASNGWQVRIIHGGL